MASPPTPTARDLEVMVAVVGHPSLALAARSLGVSSSAVKWHLETLYARLGARNRAHAAALLWPVLGDRYRLPPAPRGRRPPLEPLDARAPNRRLGRRRRHG